MHLYCASVYTSNFYKHGSRYLQLTDREREMRDSIEYYLESYHYLNRDVHVEKLRRDEAKIFLDSGAFSSFTKGVKVNLNKYCDFIKRNEDVIRKDGDILLASVLDGIGDPQLTYENQVRMEQQGVRPLPCFHYGEDERYLEYYIDNYEYITIGGMVPISSKPLKLWLDRIWEKYLTDEDGYPRLKVHGFGLTDSILMSRYPWYSVDSSSWAQVSRTGGMILMPEMRVVAVSEDSGQRKTDMQHIDTLPEPQRVAIEKRFEEMGIDVDRMRRTYLTRWSWCVWAYHEFPKYIKTERFVPEEMGLF